MESRLLLLSRSRLLLKAESSYVMLARLRTIQSLSKKVSITYRTSIPYPPMVTKGTYSGHSISQCWAARSSEVEEEDRAKTLREDLSVPSREFFLISLGFAKGIYIEILVQFSASAHPGLFVLCIIQDWGRKFPERVACFYMFSVPVGCNKEKTQRNLKDPRNLLDLWVLVVKTVPFGFSSLIWSQDCVICAVENRLSERTGTDVLWGLEFLRRIAWMCYLELRKPNKDQTGTGLKSGKPVSSIQRYFKRIRIIIFA